MHPLRLTPAIPQTGHRALQGAHQPTWANHELTLSSFSRKKDLDSQEPSGLLALSHAYSGMEFHKSPVMGHEAPQSISPVDALST